MLVPRTVLRFMTLTIILKSFRSLFLSIKDQGSDPKFPEACRWGILSQHIDSVYLQTHSAENLSIMKYYNSVPYRFKINLTRSRAPRHSLRIHESRDSSPSITIISFNEFRASKSISPRMHGRYGWMSYDSSWWWERIMNFFVNRDWQ